MKNEKLAGWYPADPKFRAKFERELLKALGHFAEHGDLSLAQRLITSVPDLKARQGIAQQLARHFPIIAGKNGTLRRDRDRAVNFAWEAIGRRKLWPARMYLSKETFSIGSERFTISELIDDFIDAIVFSRHTVPEGELQRLRETVDIVLARRRDAPSGVKASSSVRVVE
jgi:hypothetical protein